MPRWDWDEELLAVADDEQSTDVVEALDALQASIDDFGQAMTNVAIIGLLAALVTGAVVVFG